MKSLDQNWLTPAGLCLSQVAYEICLEHKKRLTEAEFEFLKKFALMSVPFNRTTRKRYTTIRLRFRTKQDEQTKTPLNVG